MGGVVTSIGSTAAVSRIGMFAHGSDLDRRSPPLQLGSFSNLSPSSDRLQMFTVDPGNGKITSNATSTLLEA